MTGQRWPPEAEVAAPLRLYTGQVADAWWSGCRRACGSGCWGCLSGAGY